MIAAAAAATTAAASRADGDPASDYLLARNVYYPYRQPLRRVSAVLERAVDRIYARGDRVKVALIYSQDDLGAIQSLFGRPAEYARFLGVELGPWYVGPLLVVDAGRLRDLRRRTIDRAEERCSAPLLSLREPRRARP